MGDKTLLRLLSELPRPVCAALTSFEVLDADRERGWLHLRFEPQPAFGNHFGAVQGGFLVPAPIAPLLAEATVLRAGSRVVFTEARLWSEQSQLLAHATATAGVLASSVSFCDLRVQGEQT